jgi:hypothetical protein
MKNWILSGIAASTLMGSGVTAFAQNNLLSAPNTTVVAETGNDQTPAQSPTRPIPTLHCTLSDARSCSVGKPCVEGKAIQGLALPMKVTADFEANIVASMNEKGFAQADEIDQTVSSAGQLMLHGVDGAFAWQMIIHDANGGVSLTMQTADTTLTAYGSCTK